MSFSGKRYWIIGASEGLGRAICEKLAAKGAVLALSARSEDRLRELADSLPGGASVHPMDVTDADAVAQAARDVGEIDGIVILQGVYWPMRAGAFDAEKVAAMFDVNLTGTARVLAHVVPDFVRRDTGHIVLTGSLSGFRGSCQPSIFFGNAGRSSSGPRGAPASAHAISVSISS